MATRIERDLPFLEHNVGPDSWAFWDDFNDLNFSATSALAKWTMLESTAGATELLNLTLTGGVLTLTQAATDNDVISLIGNAGVKVSDLKAGETLYFGCRFKTEDADDVDLHIGLGLHDTSYQASAPADYVAFQLVEGAATLNLRCSKDSVITSATAIATVSDDTWVRAFFAYTPTSTTDIGTLEYIVHSGGTRVTGSINTAGNFPDDVVIFPVIQVQNGAAAADVSSVDWIYAYASRAAFTDGTG